MPDLHFIQKNVEIPTEDIQSTFQLKHGFSEENCFSDYTQKNTEKDSVSLPIAHVPVYIKTLPYSLLMADTRRITDSLM